MRTIFHNDVPGAPMLTCFGTHGEWNAQRDWASLEFEDEPVTVGDYLPFRSGQYCWHVWETYGQDGGLALFKLTWGGAL